ncbi:MAG TPA: hypothetical protein VD763_08400 [Candidatus Saccharimonadales bacterium]|nr:hypothetical protein [Candidatus Saccharimonadales bacterium]
MGFFSGVLTGVAVAAGAAAWYMSRSGKNLRDQYHFEDRLGELGDQLERRSREIQSTVNAQIAAMQAKADEGTAGVDEALDSVAATAAEAAAEAEADAETVVRKTARKAPTE